ncbi:MAG: DUF1573 domain-containing protein [Bacteroidales bacterium]
MSSLSNIKIVLTTIALTFCSFVYSQQSNIEFNKTVHDFGDIMLNSGQHHCSFSFKNISDQPVVIQTVISSCGCAKANWTKKPIMPGESGKIDVAFLNDQGPYPFDKSLTVYITGEPRPIILRLRGVVHEKMKSLSELFPENFNGLSLRKTYIDFGNIAKGNVYTQTVEVANTSNKSLEITFSNLSKGLMVEPNKITIAAGQKEKIIFTLDTFNSNDWGKTFYNVEILINGKKVTNKKLKVYASIRDNFNNLSKKEKDNAPLPMANSSSLDFGRIRKGNEIKSNFKIRNLGQRDLLIHKIESEHSNINFKYPHKIEPGKSGAIEITVETKQEIGEKTYIISLLTNSPSRPVMNFVISGLIIQ